MTIKCKIIDTTLSENGSYTVYHLCVKTIPINNNTKSHILFKRYTDFLNLKKDLEKQYGKEIPYEFPDSTNMTTIEKNNDNSNSIAPKNWLYSIFTNSSTDLQVVKFRKKSLEAFLNNMLNDSFDTKWKQSSFTLSFLQISPEDLSLSFSSDTVNRGSNNNTTLDNYLKNSNNSYNNNIADLTSDFVSNHWWDTFRECKKILDDPNTKLIDTVKVRLLLDKLDKSLQHDIEASSLSDKAKKTKFLNSLKTKINSINSYSETKDHISAPYDSHTADELTTQHDLFGDATNNTALVQPGRVLGTNRELLEQQQQTIKQHDEELKALHKIVINQKNLALNINQEIAAQNELMDLFHTDIDHTANKVKVANIKAKKFNDR
ncbi:uncharacterized protein SCODWIG_03691 [Saccharomycodes ludwigii]|uniref:Vacuolar morphogenesis protein 7 n=1 Tax=Saccharomycodes ludwigii TaxID=36035 RepID=A0A376BCS9_9ASCO|nr:uncharacterized protein SCODWIG_03691 [Saccharomycodes ludwigii]